MDLLLDRKMMVAINHSLRAAGKATIKRRDFRWYTTFIQQFEDGPGNIEIFSAKEEMYLTIDRNVVGWAEFNPRAVQVCRVDARMFDVIFHPFDAAGPSAEVALPEDLAAGAA